MELSARAGIVAAAKAWRIPVEPAVAETVGRFFELLLQWNSRVNLTGAKELDELVGEHLADSFALASLVPEGAAVVDVGAGGGLPAVPFAILRPDCEVTLVEPRAKRAAFLGAAQRQVGASARLSLVRGRHEVLPSGAFDVATSRATFQPLEWLGLARPLLRAHGQVMVFASAAVGSPDAYRLTGEVSYRTRSGAARWVGRFVPRETSSVPLAPND